MITDQALADAYSSVMQGKFMSGSMQGFIPHIGIKEFFDKLRQEQYNEDEIYTVWESLPRHLIENNEKCGVCPKGYTKRKEGK